MPNEMCDGTFLEEAEAKWEFGNRIDANTFPRLLKLAKEAYFAKQDNNHMLDVFVAANSGTPTFANQGQAMDGYSELANYKNILKGMLERAKR